MLILLDPDNRVADVSTEGYEAHAAFRWLAWPGDAAPPAIGWVTEDGGSTFRDPLAPSLDEARRRAAAALRASCAAAITGGYPSAALGAAHAYPSAEADQRNLSDAVLAAQATPPGWSTPLWCADAAGAWVLAPHTPAQLRQVLADWLAWRAGQQTRGAALSAALRDAADLDAVRAIAWPPATPAGDPA